MRALREQLARRIASIKWPGLADPLNENVADKEIDMSQGNSATWGDLADECIRQMEWARRTATGNEKNYVVFGGLRYAFPELTPAPEDWKPRDIRIREVTAAIPPWLSEDNLL